MQKGAGEIPPAQLAGLLQVLGKAQDCPGSLRIVLGSGRLGLTDAKETI